MQYRVAEWAWCIILNALSIISLTKYSRYRIYGPRWDQLKIDHISNMTIYQVLLMGV